MQTATDSRTSTSSSPPHKNIKQTAPTITTENSPCTLHLTTLNRMTKEQHRVQENSHTETNRDNPQYFTLNSTGEYQKSPTPRFENTSRYKNHARQAQHSDLKSADIFTTSITISLQASYSSEKNFRPNFLKILSWLLRVDITLSIIPFFASDNLALILNPEDIVYPEIRRH